MGLLDRVGKRQGHATLSSVFITYGCRFSLLLLLFLLLPGLVNGIRVFFGKVRVSVRQNLHFCSCGQQLLRLLVCHDVTARGIVGETYVKWGGITVSRAGWTFFTREKVQRAEPNNQ